MWHFCGGVKTYCEPSYIFPRGQDRLNPFMIYAPDSTAVRRAFDCFSKIVRGRTCLTSRRRAAATICPRPGLQVVTRYTSCTHMERWPLPYVHFGLPVQPTKAAWWPWPFDLESGVRVTCDVGYLCANFSLPRPLCSRLRPDVRDRQTSDRHQTSDSIIA